MRQELDKNTWKRIKRVTSNSTGRTCMEVQVCNDAGVTTFTSKTDIERAIQLEVKARYALGNSAPIPVLFLAMTSDILTMQMCPSQS